jgi:TPR repeat protein
MDSKKFLLLLNVFLGLALPHIAQAEANSMDKQAQAVYNRALGGDARAQYQLAELYEKGQGGMKKDLGSAVSWYEEAAHNGLKIALSHLRKLDTD